MEKSAGGYAPWEGASVESERETPPPGILNVESVVIVEVEVEE